MKKVFYVLVVGSLMYVMVCIRLVGYIDVDMLGDVDFSKFIFRYLMIFVGRVVSWKSRL